MSEPEIAHRFNSDLLASPDDIIRARLLYPATTHVLDDPKLRALFKAHDDPANEGKRRSLIAGISAIVLGALALIVAAAEPIHKYLSDQVWFWLAVLSAAAGLVSVIIGLSGVMFWTAKSKWLRRRLMTERLRQFHFQTIVCRLPEIVASCASNAAAEQYVKQRESWLDGFRTRYEKNLGSELDKILDSDEAMDFWLHPAPNRVADGVTQDAASEMFAAYRDLRIMHQLQYANHRLRASTILPTSLKSQAAWISNATLLCILALFIIHIIIAFATPLGWKEVVFSHWTHLAAIWIAIGALAIRALEEGLKPDRELERYQHYRSAVRAIRDRFNAAQSPAEKVEVMEEMERLTFDEMCDFLRTQSKARFVL